ncbi:MAG: TylF/MycF/NovP-related O-methyltransferase [Acidimicrobiales bacterium]
MDRRTRRRAWRGIKRRQKTLLSQALPNSSRLAYLAALPKLHDWVKDRAAGCPLFADRFDLYRYVNETVIKDRPISYLEFGVFKGESITQWALTNTDDASVFVGFDTFEGLDETWRLLVTETDMKSFDVKGALPATTDHRVGFVKGYFQDTLPEFLRTFRPQHRLVIHCDADLYSSTLYALAQCNEIMTTGTVVIFDEFSSILHEFRAFEDYCAAYRRDYRTLAATKAELSYFDQVAIELL